MNYGQRVTADDTVAAADTGNRPCFVFVGSKHLKKCWPKQPQTAIMLWRQDANKQQRCFNQHEPRWWTRSYAGASVMAHGVKWHFYSIIAICGPTWHCSSKRQRYFTRGKCAVYRSSLADVIFQAIVSFWWHMHGSSINCPL